MKNLRAGVQQDREDQFRPFLARFHARYRCGLLAAGLLRAASWTIAGFVVFGLLDYFAAFGDPMRHVAARILAITALAGAILSVWRAAAVPRRAAAIAADRAARSSRREVQSALDLADSADAKASPLFRWLGGRTISGAARLLEALRFRDSVPRERLRREASALLILLLIVAVAFMVAPRAASVVSRRLLQPGADIPPFSPLRFVLTPQPAEVLYGEDILISAEIAGARLTAPVAVLARDTATGRIEESAAFQESDGRFSRKLEKMAVPIEIAFVTGRARSEWLPVNVRMQPKIQEVLLSVEPPAYSGLPVRAFAAGSQELTVLAGSRVSAQVRSNRPLKGGRVEDAQGAADSRVEARSGSGPGIVEFSWTARAPARLAITVEDVLGTSSEPLTVMQKILPDERPEAVLREPAGDVLATPESTIPLEALAADDLGLKRVAMVRRLQGYRERLRTEAVPAGSRELSIREKLDLAGFGLVPGQVIELSLEAGDTNPNLLGVSLSETSRVHIISAPQYAEFVRRQTTLEDFAGRYGAIAEAMQKAREALDRMDRRLALDPQGAESVRRSTLEAHRQAADLLAEIAKDFPAFDSDSMLSASAAEVEKKLRENIDDLARLENAPAATLSQAMPALKDRLGAAGETLSPALREGDRLVAAARVFEQAGRFNGIVEMQRGLVKDFNRLAEQVRRGEMDGAAALEDLARRQEEVSRELSEMEAGLDKALGELPEEFDAMHAGGQEFLAQVRGSNPGASMKSAQGAAAGADSRKASQSANEALRKLEELLAQRCSFAGMCRGEEARFPWPEDLSGTLAQLMKALIPRPGQGEDGAGGAGGGFGGISESGYAIRGKMIRLPIYGPPRTRFDRQGVAGSGAGSGGAGGRGTADADIGSGQVGRAKAAEPSGQAASLELVPEVYREAVKRYFSNGSEPTSQTP